MKPDGKPGSPAAPSHPRVEGVAKVTGTALYVDDLGEEAFGSTFDHAAVVTSTIAVGRIAGFDLTAALAVPGARLVMTHRDAPRLRSITGLCMSEIAELLPLQSDRVVYSGQAVAVVVADTLLAAREAASLVRIEYEESDAPCAATSRTAPLRHLRLVVPAASTLERVALIARAQARRVAHAGLIQDLTPEQEAALMSLVDPGEQSRTGLS